jgi:hypothetical protein
MASCLPNVRSSRQGALDEKISIGCIANEHNYFINAASVLFMRRELCSNGFQ